MRVKTKTDILSELKTTRTRVEQVCRKPSTYYRSYSRLKVNFDGTPVTQGGQKQYRKITETTGPLRVLQDRIKEKILDPVEMPEHVFGGVRGRSNISNAEKHLGKNHHFLTDIADFFGSISHLQVRSVFADLGYSKNASRLLTRLVTYHGSLPQGVPTSTHLANLAFLPVDERLLSICTSLGVTYTRYVDDLSFSSQQDFQDIAGDMTACIRENGYKPKRSKTAYKVGPATITGIDVSNNKLNVPPQMKEGLASLDEDSARYIGLGQYIRAVEQVR